MGLGAQPASPDVLRRKPHNVSLTNASARGAELTFIRSPFISQLKLGIFTPEVLVDMIAYGLMGAACTSLRLRLLLPLLMTLLLQAALALL